MQVVSWNVNSIRSRLERVVEWVDYNQPDALCLQETKVTDDIFPFDALEEIGYGAEVYGQKTYNGVAILTQEICEDVRRGFDDGEDEDPQARIIRATVGGVRVVNIYVPNGKAVGDEKYDYKLGWLDRLHAMLVDQEDLDGPLVLLGDFNIAPADIDVHDPERWRGRILFSEAEHAALAALMDLGLVDTFRQHHPDEEGAFSWWDYRQLAFQKRKGLRIDLVLATSSLSERSLACVIDKDARRGKGASDHAPVVADFN